ncbi:protein phosphatase 2C domain-containing protein [Thermanaerothrix sp. 4228-RoL]|uniref:Protein phosphatase 2C domain-containing protein n=1 Tax=Thermanaerothrix solaris TaxID=3058434 RepID=A0ABU3NLN2_9CHLR|nr:protein phosphatase 2C domain-containing protein [Thermanaerothrix sp. 4228-RoL]MDT8897265.1 protein phosphatase 2C domain-containing protein [Thermanaerothrix sp. 4228-RoL]
MIKFLERLLNRQKPKPSGNESGFVQTAPLSEEQLQPVTVMPLVIEPAHLLVGVGQSVGKQRERNEDALFSLSSILSDGNVELPFGVFIVADGMGGHEHGEIASGVAVRAMAEFILSRSYLPFLSMEDRQRSSLQEVMENGVVQAQQAVVRYAPGGGTTLTAALVVGEQVTLAHVGDSRAYFVYPDGRMQVVTQDHSLVHRLVELGQLSEQEAQVHPQRNVLYRALGQSEPFRPDIHTHPMPRPGFLLICSDGLWGVLSEKEMFQIITSARNPAIACKNLVDAANAAGGPDNISVILVQYL